MGAGSDDIAGQGYSDTFSGNDAGNNNTTGRNNTFIGATAGSANTTGGFNTFIGVVAGYTNATGRYNTFIGHEAGLNNTTGNYNTSLGIGAGGNDNGSNNIMIGVDAGDYNTTGNNDIYIGNLGSSSGNESSAIRIGGDTGYGYGSQTATYIAGIYGSNSSSGILVYINSNGQLGTQTSSLRFKEQVRDMGDRTSALMKLRPVTFFYKPEYAKDDRTLQYGLIAEEVAKVYPELVAYDNEGQPYAVRYQYMPPCC